MRDKKIKAKDKKKSLKYSDSRNLKDHSGKMGLSRLTIAAKKIGMKFVKAVKLLPKL